MRKLDKYWNPLLENEKPVCEKQFIHTYCEKLDAGTWREWHNHEDFYELFCMLEGSAVLCTKEETFYSQKYNAVLIPSNIQHEWYSTAQSHNYSLFLHSSILADNFSLEKPTMIEISPLLRELIIEINNIDLDLNLEENKNLALVLRDKICSAKQYVYSMPIPTNPKVAELCCALLENPRKTANLAEWSVKLECSEKTLSRIFMKETGLNFTSWQRQLKMQHAKKQLEEGKRVTDVAYACGYDSLSSFSAAYKKIYNCSPKNVYINSF